MRFAEHKYRPMPFLPTDPSRFISWVLTVSRLTWALTVSCSLAAVQSVGSSPRRDSYFLPPWMTCCLCAKEVRKDQAIIDLVEEIRVLTMLRHPCITTFMGAVDVEGPNPKLVLECMTGGSLYDLLHTNQEDLQGKKPASKPS